jgi:2-methylisocitrate lyase-like PEP mutase family enzyme
MPSQSEKGKLFRALHERDHAFIIPNPWDPGTTRVLTQLGFEALATTSAGYAFSVGQRDNTIGRERMLAHARTIVDATELPVSADFENGFGDDPDAIAETIRLAAEVGLAGCSIEDKTQRSEDTIYEYELAVERIRAAASAARALSFTFTLTARCENFLCGRPDLKDTIKRLQAYQEAGADVLFAPGVATKEDIAAVVSSVDRPVNVIGSLSGGLSLAELSALGVKRVSVGSTLTRAAFGEVLRAAREMLDHGTFSFTTRAVPGAEMNAMFD